MFGRLLKHEWRANATTLWILSACALGAGVLGTLMLRYLLKLNEDSNTYAAVGIGMGLIFIILGIIAYWVATQIILLVRFYKNKFTDEGYLTFTLPVNSHQIFLSSLLNMLLWSLISAVVVLACIAMMVFFGTDLAEFLSSDQFAEIKQIWGSAGMDSPSLALTIAQTLLSAVCSLVITMTCLTVGATVAKKHKILAAFGIYYAISVVTGIFESMINVAVSYHYFSSDMTDMVEYTTRVSTMNLLLQVVIAVACYFLATYLMKRKLNLN